MTDPLAPILRALSQTGRASSDYDLNPETKLPEGRPLRAAGVLVAFRDGANGAELLLTKRSSALRHHPGQIAFAGGKVDPNDDGPIAAALREAHEEVGLDPAIVEVLGTLPPHETVTGFLVTPVLARITASFLPIAEIGEVDEVFFVPMNHVLRAENFGIEGRQWRGAIRRYYTVPYGPYYIWGATARILRALADRCAP